MPSHGNRSTINKHGLTPISIRSIKIIKVQIESKYNSCPFLDVGQFIPDGCQI